MLPIYLQPAVFASLHLRVGGLYPAWPAGWEPAKWGSDVGPETWLFLIAAKYQILVGSPLSAGACGIGDRVGFGEVPLAGVGWLAVIG